MSRGRKPRRDELELWRKVAKSAEPLNPAAKRPEAETAIPDAKQDAPSVPKAFLEDLPSRVRGKAEGGPRHDLAPTLPDRMAKAPVQMDRKAFGQMTRGRLSPEARIDLHGMTLDRAHPALSRFILSQHAAGKRLVLVITGKGKVRDDGGPIPVRTGVLRHQVPQWLALPPMNSAVLQVSPAHQKHGGAGAYYVYLRRAR